MREDGQLIIMSGFIIAIAFVVLTILLNGVIYSGNIAYEGTMDTHEKNMLEFNNLTISETYRALNHPGNFSNYMANYTTYMSSMAAAKGISLAIDYSNVNTTTKKGNVVINYKDHSLKSEYDLIIN
jgi:hypothetical protein